MTAARSAHALPRRRPGPRAGPHRACPSPAARAAQARSSPQAKLRPGGVVTSGSEIGLVERIVGKRAGNFRAVGGKTQFLSRLAAGQAAAGAANHIAQRHVFVMVGETLRRAINAPDHPATAERRNAGIQFGLKRRGIFRMSFPLPSPMERESRVPKQKKVGDTPPADRWAPGIEKRKLEVAR